ncbi:MAG: hypothetical protein NVSMB52_00820 [Chloroflexota bacterium]
MRFAVISDILGNLSALQAALQGIDSCTPAVERIVCAGDVVGVGAYPNEVIDLLRERGIDSVRGNYDDAIARGRQESGRDFPDEAAEKEDTELLDRTRRRLTREHFLYLNDLPRDLRLFRGGAGLKVAADEGDARTNEYRKSFFMRSLFGGFARTPASNVKRVRITHGSPRAINELIREDTANSILATIARDAQSDLLITGHAGTNYVREAHNMTFVGVGQISDGTDDNGVAHFAVVTVGEAIQAEFGRATYSRIR